mmetsp:Transcript_7912/g.16859  ORF Transcript_7912/g.16859 Transcript_7912/m.16859 type:complete len:229 (+) Transcript_7912:832-1518(+)
MGEHGLHPACLPGPHQLHGQQRRAVHDQRGLYVGRGLQATGRRPRFRLCARRRPWRRRLQPALQRSRVLHRHRGLFGGHVGRRRLHVDAGLLRRAARRWHAPAGRRWRWRRTTTCDAGVEVAHPRWRDHRPAWASCGRERDRGLRARDLKQDIGGRRACLEHLRGVCGEQSCHWRGRDHLLRQRRPQCVGSDGWGNDSVAVHYADACGRLSTLYQRSSLHWGSKWHYV